VSFFRQYTNVFNFLLKKHKLLNMVLSQDLELVKGGNGIMFGAAPAVPTRHIHASNPLP
jgi:hypothetical protein